MTVNYKELRTLDIFSDGSVQGENIKMTVSYKPYPRGGTAMDICNLQLSMHHLYFRKLLFLCVCVEV